MTPELVGRRTENQELDGLIAAAHSGRSAVLVLRGEPGVGKTALLEAMESRASGCRFIRTAGVEAEMELAYAGLYPLCQPLLDRLDRLPAPLTQALGTAFGLVSGPTPDAFLVGLAVLNLFADAAADQPLVCVIDDAQWLDKMSAVILAFVARRLSAEPVVMIIAVRNGFEHGFTGLRELELGGLDRTDAELLLDKAVPGLIDPQVRNRVLAEANGNPLALLELPRTGIMHGAHTPPLEAGTVEESFEHRLAELAPEPRLLLTLAAAEPLGDPTLLWRAAERLGLGAEAATAALESDLITFGAHIRFRHPLVRSTAYRTASATDRQAAHLALAEVTDAGRDPARRAWHRAQGTAVPDEDVAADLERSAAGVRERGGHFAAGAFLERAVALTLDPELRAERILAAATARCAGGALDTALSLLDNLKNSPPDELRSALAQRLRGQIQFDQGHNQQAAATLLRAAQQLQPLKPDQAEATHLTALTAAIWAANPNSTTAAQVAAAVPVSHESSTLLQALAARFTQGYVAAAPDLVRAIAAELRDHSDEATGHLVNGLVAVDLCDLEAAQRLVARQERLARQTGALLRLRFALDFSAVLHCIAGNLAAADRLVDEQRRIAAATGNTSVEYGAVLLAALQGTETHGTGVLTRYAESVLNNGLGRYDLARDAAQWVFEQEAIGYAVLVAGELAEAASRTGDANLVESTLTWLTERANAVPTDWSRGLEARVRALSEGDEGQYRQSIQYFERTPLQGEAARSRLLYGEWLRREGRRADARGHLRTAYDALTALGLAAFAERARHELLATGETVRKRSVETANDLTTQEAQIAGLARDGLTNPEIAAQLFLSPRTVEWHLRKTFAKLGITSRRQLRDALPR